jgi:predicted GNAT family N-acyltransferase
LSADPRPTLTVRPARDRSERDAAMDLRTRVFCDEQGVGKAEEFDGLDDEALQMVVLDGSEVIGTCRLRFLEGVPGREAEDMPGGGVCKLERMAVERRLRGAGAGAVLLAGCEEAARAEGAATMFMHAQRRAESFYAAHGYEAEGEEFFEAEIPHVRMTKPL